MSVHREVRVCAGSGAIQERTFLETSQHDNQHELNRDLGGR